MSVETNSHNYTNINNTFSQLAANFFKKESRSPRGYPPRPLLRAGETEFRTPPPFPQKKEAGCGQEFRSKKVRANAKITPPTGILAILSYMLHRSLHRTVVALHYLFMTVAL